MGGIDARNQVKSSENEAHHCALYLQVSMQSQIPPVDSSQKDSSQSFLFYDSISYNSTDDSDTFFKHIPGNSQQCFHHIKQISDKVHNYKSLLKYISTTQGTKKHKKQCNSISPTNSISK